MKPRISLALLLFTTYCFSQSYASIGRMLTLEELMDTTISVSTGTQKTVAEAPSIATVITSEQIARSSATTLFELLDSVPGLFVYMNYYSSNNIDIRGIHTTHGAQVVWLINGTSMKRIQNSNLPVRFNLPTSIIERIEIIRGPGSAVYGADAFSGVINIITKNAKNIEDIHEAGVRYGSYGTSEAFARTGTAIGEAKIGVNISYMTEGKDNGRIMTKDQQSVFDNAYGTHASYAPGTRDKRTMANSCTKRCL